MSPVLVTFRKFRPFFRRGTASELIPIESAHRARIVVVMPSRQLFLFAPEKPLVERLGQRFFRELPKVAGVYKMRDAQGRILYVGKAKNLRQRLGSYRVANPERLGRRHLRLLQRVARIEFEVCAGELSALRHEAKLIRELKPRFNRAGVWQGKPQFLTWRFAGDAVEIAVQETPNNGWERFGPLSGYAPRLKHRLARLIWLAVNPDQGFHQMPFAWTSSRTVHPMRIECVGAVGLREVLAEAFVGNPTGLLDWLAPKLNGARVVFDRAAMQNDLAELQEFFIQQHRAGKCTSQRVLL